MSKNDSQSINEFQDALPYEILDKLKCPYCKKPLVAKFYNEDGKYYEAFTPYHDGNGNVCAYCSKTIPNSDLVKQINLLKS